MAIVVGVVLRAGSGGFASGWVLGLTLLGALAALVLGWLRWANERYELDGTTLRHRRGVISPDETSVPLTRIQALDTSQGPIQRLFGVFAVHIQTAGGGAKGEIELRALSSEAVRALRAGVGLEQPATRELPEWRLGRRRLLVAALTAPQFGVVLPLLGALAAGLDNVLSGDAVRQLVDRAPSDAGRRRAAGGRDPACRLAALVPRRVRGLRRLPGRARRRAPAHPARAAAATQRERADPARAGGRRRRGHAATAVRPGRGADRGRRLPLRAGGGADALSRRAVGGRGRAAARLRAAPRRCARPAAAAAGARARRRYVLPPLATGTLLGVGVLLAWSPGWPLAAAAGSGGRRGRASAATAPPAGAWPLGRSCCAGAAGRRRAPRWWRALGRLQEEELAQNPFQRRAQLADLSVAVGSGKRGRVAQLELSTAQGLFERLRSLGSEARVAASTAPRSSLGGGAATVPSGPLSS